MTTTINRPFTLKTTPNKTRTKKFELFAPHCLDSYKLGHGPQYPAGTEYIYSNFTPRSDRHLDIPLQYQDRKYVVYGTQGMLKELIALWDETFFSRPLEECLAKYRARVPAFTGREARVQHLADLHALGYLPIRVKLIAEGSYVNIGVPFMTIVNTLPTFAWLTNSLETYISNETWKSITVATIAFTYYRILLDFAKQTGASEEFVRWQGHCFADRGMSGMMDAAKNTSGHTLPFFGTDSVSSLDWIDFAYQGKETFIGGSVPATEHSVMTTGGVDGEYETIRRIITEVEPDGVVSFVADTYNFWRVITEYLPRLKPEILARGYNALGLSKVVVRPDSGDPADILCGTARGVPELSWEGVKPFLGDIKAADGVLEYKGIYYKLGQSSAEGHPTFTEVTPTPQQKGAIACLYDGFGGDVSDKGFITVMQRVGAIYGDSITPHRCLKICERLKEKGFSSGTEVLGIGLI